MGKIKIATIALGLFVAQCVAQAQTISVKSDTPVTVSVTQASWHLQGPFARQVVELTVANPSSRNVEATLYVNLQPHEQIKAYALDIGGVFRDAVPVPRAQARRAFEEVTYRQVDPSLVEKEGANSYKIRIFPVPPNGLRKARIELASLAENKDCGWSHKWSSLGNYGQTRLTIFSSIKPKLSKQTWTWDANLKSFKTSSKASQSLAVCLPSKPLSHFKSTKEDYSLQWVEAEVPAVQGIAGAKLPRQIEVLWDTSLSMKTSQESALRALQQLIDELFNDHPDESTLTVKLSLLNHRWQQEEIVIERDNKTALVKKLQAIPYDGATHLAAWQPAQNVDAVAIFSDLKNTWPAQQALPSFANKPVYVFLVGQNVDLSRAHALTRQGGGLIDTTQGQSLATVLQKTVSRLAFDELNKSWVTNSLTAQNQHLRACRITQDRSYASFLPMLQAGQQHITQLALPEAQEENAIDFWCATWRAESLELDSEANSGELERLGKVFNVVNQGTSLLVLEQAQDYVTHGVEPPRTDEALYAQYTQLLSRVQNQRASANLNIEKKWEDRKQWWKQEFPKGDKPKPAPRKERPVDHEEPQFMESQVTARSMPAPMAVPAAAQDRQGPDGSSETTSPSTTTLTIHAVKMDAPYAQALLTSTTPTEVYQHVYLAQRANYERTPAFYFDVADRLFELGDTDKGVQVLSNLVELLPNDLDVLRTIAYRLEQAKQHQWALDVLLKVKLLAPDQPQTWRDLGLLYAKLGQCDAAMASLKSVATTNFAQRAGDIDVIALAEMNDLALHCSSEVWNQVPDSLKAELPIGLRVVLKWDQNATDVDLHVQDPNGETVYYGSRSSYQGGRVSSDVTNGFGPEEFILKDPKPGVYKILVNYYGSRMSTYKRGTTVGMQLQTNFASKKTESKELTFRLLEQTGLVPVAEFTVGKQGQLDVQSK